MRLRLDGVGADAARYMVGKLLTAVGMLLAIPILSRQLGAVAFGELGLWLALVVWVSGGLSGWLVASVIRFHQENAGHRGGGAYLATLRALTVLASAATGAIVFVVAASSELSVGTAGLLALVAATTTTTNVGLAVAKAELRPWTVGIAEGVRAFGFLGSVVVAPLLLGSIDLEVAAGCYCASQLACALVLRGSLPASLDARVSRQQLRALTRYGLPMSVWFVVSIGHVMVARPILDWMGMEDALGLYVAAQDILLKGGALVLMPVAQAVSSRAMARHALGETRAIRGMQRRAMLGMLAMGAPLVFVAWWLGGHASSMLFGEATSSMQHEAILVMILAAGVVAARMANVTHLGLQVARRPRVMARLGAAGLVVNVVGCWVLVPWLGPVGAAVSFLIVQVGYAAITWRLSGTALAE